MLRLTCLSRTDQELTNILTALEAEPKLEAIYFVNGIAATECSCLSRRSGNYFVTDPFHEGETRPRRIKLAIDQLNNGPVGGYMFGRDWDVQRKEIREQIEAELRKRHELCQRQAEKEASLKSTRRYLVTQHGVEHVYHERQFVVEVPPGVDEDELDNSTLELLANEVGVQWYSADDCSGICAEDFDIEGELSDGACGNMAQIGYSTEEAKS